ncbi:hypothetical protein CVT24_013205 [Panaeolus cyanescens]|uniref:MARVEL domain-containing protein n=1 Tax=Panaeolus cyanescens TaxID=181874 RepID=A0A409YMN7_9AGAR|nr:hypothetical protein CVT24_013205 [Panaeolus cyanescens]
MALSGLRLFLYAWLFATSVVLLGLTAYRIHYTKNLTGGDILTNSSHFYDPIIAELVVTSSLAILASLWYMIAIASRIGRGPLGTYLSEQIFLFIIWVMFLVGAAITTHKWLHLKWCRGGYRACRILETIKGFSWICFGFTSFLLLASLANMMMNRHTPAGPVHGKRDDVYPETRQTTTTTTARNTTAAPATGAGTGATAVA